MPEGSLTEDQTQIDVFSAPYKRDTVDCRCDVTCYAHGDHGEDVGPHRWYIPQNACHGAACSNPWCLARNSRDRAKRVRSVYDRLWSIIPADVAPRYAAFVFTLPADCRTDKLDLLGEVRQAARKVASEWMLNLAFLPPGNKRRAGWELAGVDVYHPEGDRDPGVWKPHIHMQIPAVAHRRGDTQECLACQENWHSRDQLPPCDFCRLNKPRWKILQVAVDKDDLFNLRRSWGVELMRIFGWRPAGGDPSRCSVDYKWRTMARPGPYHHRIKYDFRHWAQYQGYFRSIRWFGYLSPKSQSRIGLPAKIDDKKEKQSYNVCPACGRIADISLELGAVRGIDDNLLTRVHAPPWVIDAKRV